MELTRRFIDSFAGRVLAVCGAVLAVLLAASLVLHDMLQFRAAERGTAEIVRERLTSVIEILAVAPQPERLGIAKALTAPDLELHWGQEPLPVPAGTSIGSLRPARAARLAEQTDEIRSLSGGIDAEYGVLRWIGIQARLRDGTWVDARLATVSLLQAADTAFHAYVGAVALALLLLAGLAAQAIASPLATLARSVERLVPGGAAPVPPVGGPREVRRVAEALDAMAGRVREVLRQRSITLAALSHDLMSPIARLKLRADELPDVTVRRAFLHDLAEMESMVADALAFLRGGDDTEPAVPLSVVSLLLVVVDEFAEAGQGVEERRLCDAAIRGRPVALKRAIRNLLANAFRHGRDPWVAVERRGAEVVIVIGDRGPGLPPEDRARAFEPFYRGDRARAAGGGSGLGLPTARAIAEAHRGSLDLVEAPGGGMLARLSLPRLDDEGNGAGLVAARDHEAAAPSRISLPRAPTRRGPRSQPSSSRPDSSPR
jgi:signal transduction histidine kinase